MLGLFVVVLLWTLTQSEPSSERFGIASNITYPNIIIFLADDLGYGDLSFSGHPTSRTPAIDALASRGKYFTHSYATSPVCSPSRASLLTGRYQVRSGSYPGTYIPSSILGLPKNETTIAKLLKEKGYMTQIVGKWHLGVGIKNEFLPSNPAYGFDRYFGVPYSHDMCPCPVCFPNNGSCFDGCWKGYVSCPLFKDQTILEQPVYLPDLTHRYLEAAATFLTSASQRKTPFLLFFAFHHIHHPQFASSRSQGTSVRGATGDSLLELDWAVGRIVKYLKTLKMMDNTLIWFTSDNGPSLMRHERGGCAGLLRCGKGTTMEGGIRVPSFVFWQKRIPAGRSNALTSSLDILPTLASIVGADVSQLCLDGVDLSDVLFSRREKPSPRKFLAVYLETPSPKLGPFAVIYKNFKAHFYTKGSDLSDAENYDPMCPGKHNLTKQVPPLLYELYSDPGERYNLGTNDNYKNIIALMTKWREHHMKKITWMPPRTQQVNHWAEPCCSYRGCNPFPDCCDCKNPSQLWQKRTMNQQSLALCH